MLGFLTSDISSPNCSWIWRDILLSKKLILQGACHTVSINSTLRIWDDPWIPTLPHFKPTLNPHNALSTTGFNLLRSLMIDGSNLWNISLLIELFPPEVVKEIRKITICLISKLSSLIWTPSSSGIFTTKSAYLTYNNHRISSTSQAIIFPWKHLWKAKLHNRHKLLLWKLIHDILPTRAKLNYFFPISPISCPICNHPVESSDHIFISCPLITQLWSLSKWNFSSTPFTNSSLRNFINSILDNKNTILPPDVNRDAFIVFMVVLFDNVWTSRNQVTHGGTIPSISLATKWTANSSMRHWNAQINIKVQATSLTSRIWIKPQAGWIKTNSDCRFIDGISSSVFFIRNHNGSILFASAYEYHCTNALVAELFSIRDACIFFSSKGMDRVVFEGDSLLAMTFINDPTAQVYWMQNNLWRKSENFGIFGRNGNSNFAPEKQIWRLII